MGATFSSWRAGAARATAGSDAEPARRRDGARRGHSPLPPRARKHDRRLDKRARARRTLAWARGDPGAPAPSSPTLRARGPSVASVGKRGGGLGEFGLDRRDGTRRKRRPAGRAGDAAGTKPNPKPAREYDIIRAGTRRRWSWRNGTGRGARRAAAARRAGKKEKRPEARKSGKEEPGGGPSFAVVRASPRAAPAGNRTSASRLREPRGEPNPASAGAVHRRRRLRAGYEQVKVFRDGNSLFHCARLGEIVCQARSERIRGRGRGRRRTRKTTSPRPRDSVAAVLRRGSRSLGRAQAATAAALRRGR